MASNWISTVKAEVSALKKSGYKEKDLMKKAIANAKKKYNESKKTEKKK